MIFALYAWPKKCISCDPLHSLPYATSPKPLYTSKISFKLVKSAHAFQCALALIMGKILFCLVDHFILFDNSVQVNMTEWNQY